MTPLHQEMPLRKQKNNTPKSVIGQKKELFTTKLKTNGCFTTEAHA